MNLNLLLPQTTFNNPHLDTLSLHKLQLTVLMDEWLNNQLATNRQLLGGVPLLSSLNQEQLFILQRVLCAFLISLNTPLEATEGIATEFLRNKINAEMSLFKLAAMTQLQRIQLPLIEERITLQGIQSVGMWNGVDSNEFHSLENKTKKIVTLNNSQSPRLDESKKQTILNKPISKVARGSKRRPIFFAKLKGLTQCMLRNFAYMLILGSKCNKSYAPYQQIITSTIEEKVGPEKSKEIIQAISEIFQKMKESSDSNSKPFSLRWVELRTKFKSVKHLGHDLGLLILDCLLNLVKAGYLDHLARSTSLSAKLCELLIKDDTKPMVARWIKKNFFC